MKNLTDIVMFVLKRMKVVSLEKAICDAANTYSKSPKEYAKIWNFLTSLVW